MESETKGHNKEKEVMRDLVQFADKKAHRNFWFAVASVYTQYKDG